MDLNNKNRVLAVKYIVKMITNHPKSTGYQ